MKNALAPALWTQCCRLELRQRSEATAAASLATPDLPWTQAGDGLALVHGEIHLWRAQLDQEAPGLELFNASLSEEERQRAHRLIFPKDRRRFIIRRGLLRRILGHYAHVEPARVRFSHGPRGKLAVSSPANDLHFNLSHSDGLALYAVTRDGAVGVDLERLRVISETEQIMARFFSPRERAQWQVLPDSQRAEAFLRLWTRHEASLKSTGRGITDAWDPILSLQ